VFEAPAEGKLDHYLRVIGKNSEIPNCFGRKAKTQLLRARQREANQNRRRKLLVSNLKKTNRRIKQREEKGKSIKKLLVRKSSLETNITRVDVDLERLADLKAVLRALPKCGGSFCFPADGKDLKEAVKIYVKPASKRTSSEEAKLKKWTNGAMIGQWCVSKVTNFEKLFDKRRINNNFNEAIGKWDTGNVKTMESLFFKQGMFNQEINSWDTSKVRPSKVEFIVHPCSDGIINLIHTLSLSTGRLQVSPLPFGVPALLTRHWKNGTFVR
jgi:hypothetical protein